MARFPLQVNEAGKIAFNLRGKLSKLTVFVDDTEITGSREGVSEVIELTCEKGTSIVTVVGLLGGGMEEFSVELLGEPGVIEVAQ